jgi:hypothetical protein
VRDRPTVAAASGTLLHSYLVLLTAIMLGLWGAPVWGVVGVATLLLMLPSLTNEPESSVGLWLKHRRRNLLTLERAVTMANALVLAMASYVLGRAIAWLLTV